MKTFTIRMSAPALLLTLFFPLFMQAQVYNGNLTLSSQAEVDSFNYTEVTGSLTVTGGDITDLSPLAPLATVGGGILINDNPALTNMTGLSSLSFVGSEFFIGNNPVLSGVEGLTSLTSTVGNLNVSYNGSLTSLSGLSNLTAVGSILKIDENPALTSLEGLESLTSVGSTFWVTENTSLTEFCAVYSLVNGGGISGSYSVSGNAANPTLQEILDAGPCPVVCMGDVTLSSQAEVDAFACDEITGNLTITGADITDLGPLSALTTVGGDLYINENPALTNVDGLSSLTSVGGIFEVFTNVSLTSLNGVNSLTSVGKWVNINNNHALITLEGLSSLSSVTEGFYIQNSDALTSIDGLSSLVSIGTEFYIYKNSSLTNVDGLSALTSVGGSVWIHDSDALTNLDGLAALASVGGNLTVNENGALAEFCGLHTLLNGGGLAGAYSVSNNAANPTQQEIIDAGPCQACPGDPTVFGDNVWNVYAWNAGGAEIPNDEAWNLNYSGYYVEDNLSFDTEDRWDVSGSPSDADGYVGCPVDVDNHSFSYKRKGFPEGNYTINIDGHDDAAQLFVNGTNVWEHNGCCDSHLGVWEGILGADDEVEFRVTEAFFGSLGKLSFVQCPGGEIIFVNDDASGSNDGTSWENAFNDLQDGIDIGNGCPDVTQVWVASGMYKPTSDGDRSISFVLKNNLAIYGGFEGNEDPQTFNLADRDFVANETTLSGDIGVESDSTDNSFNVVRTIGNDNTAILDGFTIQEGQADAANHERGGGLLVVNGNPVIKNCHITDNYALGGAGISIEGINAQSTYEYCTIVGNRSLGGGGGVIVGFGAKPVFETCTFSGNQGGLGGGVSVFSNGSNPVFNNCVFQGNTSLDFGGGVSSIADAMPDFNTCTFAQNTAAGSGGGVYSTGKSISFNDCSFSQNTAEGGGGAVQAGSQPLTFTNCEFTQNTSTGSFGGAINGSAGLLITDCLFEGNSAPAAAGGAINFGNVPGTISGTSFVNNTALGGGALAYFAFDPNAVTVSLTDCHFQGNNSVAGGGAIWNGFSNTDGSTQMIFSNCTFVENTAFDGVDVGTGGAYQSAQVGHNATFTNCLLDGNKALGSADDGGGVIMTYAGTVNIVNSTLVNNESASHGGAVSVFNANGSVSIKNSILWNNTAVSDQNIYNGNGGTANIEYSLMQEDMCPANVICGNGMIYNFDPLFAGADDYHLQACSPAIDAGTNDGAPTTDLDGNPRPFSPGGLDPAMSDMGCYEYSVSTDLCAACATVAFAGEDAAIMVTEDYQLADATAENYVSLVWTTGGDGTFDDENAVNPTYFPGTLDVDAGSVILTLSLEGLSSCGVGASDDMTLMLNSPPTVEITSPMEGDVLYGNPATVEGTAADVDNNLAEVFVMVNDGDWMPADGTENWNSDLTLIPGENTIKAKAVDAMGLESDIDMITVTLSGQNIPLAEGWSIISSYLSPVDPAMEIVMANTGIPGNLIFMNGSSGIFWPEFGVNTIGDWNVFEGYKVKTAQPDVLFIGGDKLADNSVSFGPGFHYIPVLSDMPAPIDVVFADPENDIQYIFDQATAQIYWPDGGIFSLEELTPGRGYPALFLNDVTLGFPDYQNLKSTFVPEIIAQSNNAPWSFVKTGNHHQVAIAQSALDDLDGAEYIGAFDAYGNCVGAAYVEASSGNYLLTIYGDDPTTAEKDGAADIENLTFKAYQSGTNSDLELSPVFSNKMPDVSAVFVDNGQSMITDFKASSTGVGESFAELSVELFPNPARESVTLVCPDYSADSHFEIEIVNAGGELVEKVKLTAHSTSINLERLNKGVFFMKITSQHASVIKKLIIQ